MTDIGVSSDLLTVQQAIAILDATAVAPRVLRVKLQAAHGLRLAQDVVADRDAPPFDKSLMDGFAVRCADVSCEGQVLKIVGEIPAGTSAATAITTGQAMAIMTGAPLPDGADGVVPVEDVERPSASDVRILRTPSPGRYIARRGSDCRAGVAVLSRGAMLRAPQLAVAASVGAAQVDVVAAPRASVLCTGDELVDIEQTPGPWQIRNSNNLMMIALLRQLGCEVRDLGTVRDDPPLIRRRIEDGLSDDALFITGGMSMGQHDYVPRILRELNVQPKITKLRIKPGKPFVFGIANAESKPCYVFGLPGNPVSSFVCTVRLAARLLRRLAGGEPEPRWLDAPLLAPLEPNGPREFYQPASLEADGVLPLQWKGSADIYTLARATGLIVRGENEPALAAGQRVRVLEI